MTSIEDMKRLCEKATKGPWSWGTWRGPLDPPDFNEGRACLYANGEDVIREWATFADDAGINITQDDAEFIAAAREFIPWAIAQIDRVLGVKE